MIEILHKMRFDILNNISKYRSNLMAIAILGPLSTHVHIRFGNSLIDNFFDKGYGGVDVFFFLSGLGLYFSCSKDNNIFHFWWKRIKRIFPALLTTIIISALCLNQFNISYILKELSLIGFWIPSLRWPTFAWFISSIVVFYIIYPLYYKPFRRHPNITTCIVVMFGLLLCAGFYYYFFVISHGIKPGWILMIARIPAFFIGSYFGLLIDKNKVMEHKTSLRSIIGVFIAGLLFYSMQDWCLAHYGYKILRNTGILFLMFLPMILPLFILESYIFSKLPNLINKTISYIGNSTLEIYLLLGLSLHYQKYITNILQGSQLMGSISTILLNVVAGVSLHFLLQKTIFLIKKLFHMITVS